MIHRNRVKAAAAALKKVCETVEVAKGQRGCRSKSNLETAAIIKFRVKQCQVCWGASVDMWSD